MNWILIGILANTLMAQPFDTREACEGRAVILKESKVAAKCVDAPRHSGFVASGTYTLPNSGLCFNTANGFTDCP